MYIMTQLGLALEIRLIKFMESVMLHNATHVYNHK